MGKRLPGLEDRELLLSGYRGSVCMDRKVLEIVMNLSFFWGGAAPTFKLKASCLLGRCSYFLSHSASLLL
jgi:hypothetical protein